MISMENHGEETHVNREGGRGKPRCDDEPYMNRLAKIFLGASIRMCINGACSVVTCAVVPSDMIESQGNLVVLPILEEMMIMHSKYDDFPRFPLVLMQI
jgi:hypothetical protein